MNIYCVKCKSKTSTNNIANKTSKNGKNMVIGNCSNCGSKKSVFIKSDNKQTGGFLPFIPRIENNQQYEEYKKKVDGRKAFTHDMKTANRNARIRNEIKRYEYNQNII